MKKFISIILFIFLLSGCSIFTKHPAQNQNTETYGYTQMRYTMNKVLTISQVDSMIVADNLTNLKDWLYVPIGRNNTDLINQYIFIKDLSEEHELIYVATQINRDTLYKCTKRLLEKIDE